LVNLTITRADPSQDLKEVDVAAKRKFTKIPKINDLISAGVPVEAIPTYCAISDYSNNKTGLCWPKMETIASTLNRSVRTVQRHLHLLRQKGVIEFVERRRHKGRFSSYTYKILHIATTGHTYLVEKRHSIYKGTKQLRTPPKSPIKQGYEWLFDVPEDPKAEANHQRERADQQKGNSERRKEGYEWLFE